jgi:hypothetical protein
MKPKTNLYPSVSTKHDLESLNSESFELLLSIWLHFLNFGHTFGFDLTRCGLAIARSAHEMKREKIGQISYINLP